MHVLDGLTFSPDRAALLKPVHLLYLARNSHEHHAHTCHRMITVGSCCIYWLIVSSSHHLLHHAPSAGSQRSPLRRYKPESFSR